MTSTRLPLATLLSLVVAGAPLSSRADNAVPPDSPPDSEAAPSRPVDDETDPLLRKLIGDSVVDAGDDDPLTAAAELMERAGRRIGNERDSGTGTRDLQKRAIDDLEKLIELARQQQSNRQSSPSGGRPMPMPDGGRPEDMPDEGGTGEAGSSTASGDDGPRRQDGEASESTAATEAARDREAALAERRRLVKDVWGHLPPTMREELLNAYSDRALPKYEELVRAYFRALAERTNDDEN